ncbi:MAG: bis(5'-nucleosyl)-tetraphosphatase [Burkholderiales bacterium]|nr:NUDIX domain-containing protein [Burkholderiales bacterium]MDQ3195975.1 NUDIX domain-containing protein [Pseudomonadota bacterium]
MAASLKSAGIVVVRPAPAGLEFLVLRAWRNWDFPKGLIEPGEDPVRTALRETFEETGVVDLVFRWGDGFAETAPYARNKIARYYLAEAKDAEVRLAPNPILGRPEHHEYRWVTHENAARLLPERLRPVLEWAHLLVNGKR